MGTQTCKPGGDEDCKATDNCRRMGECHARDGKCVAVSDDDCKHLSKCTEEGRCAAREGRCVVTEEGCRATSMCKSVASCSVNGTMCWLMSDADCRFHDGCAASGSCVKRGPICVAGSDEDCERSQRCREDGACARAPKTERCITKDEHCLLSKMCEAWGMCKRVGDRCEFGAKSDAACRRGRGTENHNPCRFHGYCSVKDGYCTALTDADCRRSDLCKQANRCKADKGVCR
jgi:hypothetical protein